MTKITFSSSCKCLAVSTSGYCAWRKRQLYVNQKYTDLKAIYWEYHTRIGPPSLTHDMHNLGYCMSELLKNLTKDKADESQKYLLILDNASIHKGQQIDEVVHRYNARLMYLPAYSPDLNPIEKAWSVLKRKVRHMVSQKQKTVIEALDIAFNQM